MSYEIICTKHCVRNGHTTMQVEATVPLDVFLHLSAQSSLHVRYIDTQGDLACKIASTCHESYYLPEFYSHRDRIRWYHASQDAVANARHYLGSEAHTQHAELLLAPFLWYTIAIESDDWEFVFKELRKNRIVEPILPALQKLYYHTNSEEHVA